MKRTILLSFALFSGSILLAQAPSQKVEQGDVFGNISQESLKDEIIDITQIKDGESYDGNFSGKVIEVCAKKGCWIQLKLSDGKSATVKMKDYSFFVSTDLEGKEIQIQGKAELKVTSVAELQHIAEDGKKSKEEIDAITEPKETISILANGIIVK